MVSVAVIGEVVLDCVVTNGVVEKVPGGCAANEALALARYGAKVDLRARYSVDQNGQFLKNFIAEHGIDIANSISAKEPALVITITKDETGHPTYNYGELLACADWQWTSAEIDRPLPSDCDGIVIGSMASVFPPGTDALFNWVQNQKTAGLPVFYDINARPGSFTVLDEKQVRSAYQRWLELATVVKVSDEDLDWWAPGEDPLEVAQHISTQGPELVALTQGASGVTMFAHGERLFTIAPPVIQAADTVGAGDTFLGWLTAGILELPPELRFDTALIFSVTRDAVFAAAYNCTKTGCNPPTQQELADFSA
jgi:fructokinase